MLHEKYSGCFVAFDCETSPGVEADKICTSAVTNERNASRWRSALLRREMLVFFRITVLEIAVYSSCIAISITIYCQAQIVVWGQ